MLYSPAAVNLWHGVKPAGTWRLALNSAVKGLETWGCSSSPGSLLPRLPHMAEQHSAGEQVLATVHSSGGLGLPKSILTLRPSLSNWLKMIWDLPVCQFLIWQRTRPRWLLGESQNVCVCQHKYACGHVCWIGLHRRFQGLWDCLKRHKECDFVLVLSCAYAHIVETNSLCSATHQDSSSICGQKLSPQTVNCGLWGFNG